MLTFRIGAIILALVVLDPAAIAQSPSAGESEQQAQIIAAAVRKAAPNRKGARYGVKVIIYRNRPRSHSDLDRVDPDSITIRTQASSVVPHGRQLLTPR